MTHLKYVCNARTVQCMYKITASPYIILDHYIILKVYTCITWLICSAFIFQLHFYAEKLQDWPKITQSSFWGKILCRAFLHKRRNVFTKREHQTPFSKGKQSTISGSRKGIFSRKEFLTSLYSCQIYHVLLILSIPWGGIRLLRAYHNNTIFTKGRMWNWTGVCDPSPSLQKLHSKSQPAECSYSHNSLKGIHHPPITPLFAQKCISPFQ